MWKSVNNLVWLILVLFATPFVLAEVPLPQKVEDAIRAAEPGWKCTHAGLEASPIVPSEKRLLISRWERRSTTGQQEGVELWIFQVGSPADAEKSLSPMREGKVAAGWKVNSYSTGDEAYLGKFRDGERYEIQFRKGLVVVRVSSDSMRLAERFAKYADNCIGTK
ncbi:MAG TPA: hypothetical protein VG498_13695 [Terriglobales bacterium]|nr:hypothetical protein [Terriglobales bacterium]